MGILRELFTSWNLSAVPGQQRRKSLPFFFASSLYGKRAPNWEPAEFSNWSRLQLLRPALSLETSDLTTLA
jgi:hypothetical protein